MTFLSVLAMIVASYSSSSRSFSLFFPTGRGEGDDDDDASTTTIPVAREELEEVLREENEDAS